MQVKLTESGLDLLDRAGDLAIIEVSNARAYHLMENGHANQDKRFMQMFRANNHKKAAKEKPKPGPKKEKATSKKAAAREKAIKK